MTLVDRIVRRYAAAMSPEKMKEILLKFRKGSTSSLSVKVLIEVLQYLGGWRIEPINALVEIHRGNGYETGYTQKGWDQAKKAEVNSLPSNPKPGQLYTMEIGDLDTKGYFKYKAWVGTGAIRFTSPEGKIYELMAEPHDLMEHSGELRATKYLKPLAIPLYHMTPWLNKETKFLEQVSNALGMETHEKERENSKPRTRENTGTCACCFRNIKLRVRGEKLPLMAMHGYKRPGWGFIHGSCLGVDFPPFELSPDGTIELRKQVMNAKDLNETYLGQLQKGEVKSITQYNKTWTPEEAGERWKYLVQDTIDSVERKIKYYKRDIEELSKLIAGWKQEPLPFEGDKLRPIPKLFM